MPLKVGQVGKLQSNIPVWGENDVGLDGIVSMPLSFHGLHLGQAHPRELVWRGATDWCDFTWMCLFYCQKPGASNTTNPTVLALGTRTHWNISAFCAPAADLAIRPGESFQCESHHLSRFQRPKKKCSVTSSTPCAIWLALLEMDRRPNAGWAKAHSIEVFEAVLQNPHWVCHIFRKPGSWASPAPDARHVHPSCLLDRTGHVRDTIWHISLIAADNLPNALLGKFSCGWITFKTRTQEAEPLHLEHEQLDLRIFVCKNDVLVGAHVILLVAPGIPKPVYWVSRSVESFLGFSCTPSNCLSWLQVSSHDDTRTPGALTQE